MLRDLFPAGRTVDPEDLAKLRAPQPVLEAAFRTALIAGNPWLAALRGLREDPAANLDERMIPVEEGETSLNANAHQALASLLVLVQGHRQGLCPTILGTLAGGNHGLDHSLARLARSFPDPDETRRRLADVFGPAALASAEELLASRHRSVRKSFAGLPATLQRARALRLPPCLIEAPEAGRLADLASTLGLDPHLRDLLADTQEKAARSGLETVADLFLLVRARLLRRLAGLLGANGTHVPATLEALLTRGTGDLAQRTLPDLVAALRPPSLPGQRRASGRFRALHYWDPIALLTRGGRTDGWSWLWASFEGGALYASPSEKELLDLPLATLLARGHALSGRLLYPAVRRLNGGAVCNQLFSSPRPAVFAGLATLDPPNLVLPLTWTNVNGTWQTGADPARRPPLDLLVLTQWIERATDPPAALTSLLDAFLEATRAPARGGIVLGERPGRIDG